jgi:ADP-ribose pyrophosphatase YjhB (NUDIX family)
VDSVDATREPGEDAAGEVPAWLQWARRLQALAQSGLTYARDPYDIERYEAVREIAVEVLAAHAGMPRETVRGLFAADAGYATPKLDVRGVVFRDDGALLLVRERSDGGWTLPGGWVDVGEAPSEAVEKEVRQESGYVVRAAKVLALLDRDRHGHPPHAHHIWKVFIRCSLVGGAAAGPGLETEGVGFFHADAIPPLSLTRVVPAEIARLFEHYAHPDWPTDFD